MDFLLIVIRMFRERYDDRERLTSPYCKLLLSRLVAMVFVMSCLGNGKSSLESGDVFADIGGRFR